MSIENSNLAQVVHRLALSESGFVFDPASGTSFTVNETGLTILRQLQGNTDLQQTLLYLSQHFNADEADLSRDLDDFVAALVEQLGVQ